MCAKIAEKKFSRDPLIINIFVMMMEWFLEEFIECFKILRNHEEMFYWYNIYSVCVQIFNCTIMWYTISKTQNFNINILNTSCSIT